MQDIWYATPKEAVTHRLKTTVVDSYGGTRGPTTTAHCPLSSTCTMMCTVTHIQVNLTKQRQEETQNLHDILKKCILLKVCKIYAFRFACILLY